VAVAKSSLRILMVERLGEAFNQSAVRLRYTPRAFALDPVNRSIYVAEADHGAVPLAELPDSGGAAPMEDAQAGPQVLPRTQFWEHITEANHRAQQRRITGFKDLYGGRPGGPADAAAGPRGCQQIVEKKQSAERQATCKEIG
jgi:hypothetical protein